MVKAMNYSKILSGAEEKRGEEAQRQEAAEKRD